MEMWVPQNAFQCWLSACPQQEPREAMPQVTAFSFSAHEFYSSRCWNLYPADAGGSKPLKEIVKQQGHAHRCMGTRVLLNLAENTVLPQFSLLFSCLV